MVIYPISPSPVVIEGTSVTYTFSPALNTEVGTCYKAVIQNLRQNHTGREEEIFIIGGTSFPVVRCDGEFVTSHMMKNPNKLCPYLDNIFLIRIEANGPTPSVVVKRGLGCRDGAYLDVVTPPTP
jgi:hypothetical protein